MRIAAPALLAAALLAAGCVTRTTASTAWPGADSPAPEGEELRIEGDRARVVLPATAVLPEGGAREIRWEGTLVRTREAPVDVQCAGEGFSVIAEGGVLLRRRAGARTVEEGPYHVVILKDGNLLRR